MAVFEVKSKLNKEIRLTEIQWIHISVKHPELVNQSSKMVDTLKSPDIVYYCPEEDNYQYHKYFKETPISEKYLLVIVRHLNDEGFVITAFFIRKISKEKKEIIYGEKDFDKL